MLVIPIFIPHWGCPHQCSFCNQKTIAQPPVPLDFFEFSFHRTIADYLSCRGSRSHVELAFFGGNFLGLSPERIVWLLDLAKPYLDQGSIHGIRCSTRPDTIHEQSLALLENRSISLIEVGVQSMNDQVLAQCMRRHTRQDALSALDCLSGHGIPAGVQVMAGLPGESQESFLSGIQELACLHPVTARIYPLVVLAKSPLATQYRKGEYLPLSLSDAVSWARQAYEIFSMEGVKVIRMGLQASEILSDSENVLAGPYHPAFGHLVFSSLFWKKTVAAIHHWLDNNNPIPRGRGLCLCIHPRSQSRFRGDKNANMVQLTAMFPDISFSIAMDSCMAEDEVQVSLD